MVIDASVQSFRRQSGASVENRVLIGYGGCDSNFLERVVVPQAQTVVIEGALADCRYSCFGLAGIGSVGEREDKVVLLGVNHIECVFTRDKRAFCHRLCECEFTGDLLLKAGPVSVLDVCVVGGVKCRTVGVFLIPSIFFRVVEPRIPIYHISSVCA